MIASKSSVKQVMWIAACVAGVVVLAAAAGVLFTNNPETSRLFPPCPVFAVTGLYCPGCGSTRASHHLMHGRVATAMTFNPLMVISIPIVVAMLLRPRITRRPITAWAAAAILIVYALLRNLPWEPFASLAPG